MSDKNPLDFRDPERLTVSEIDRYADCSSDSEEYSSGDSYRPSANESSDDEDNFGETTTIDNSSIPDTNSPGPSNAASPAVSTNFRNVVNTTPPRTVRGKKPPRRVLPWNDLPQLKTFLFNEATGLKVPIPENKPIDWFTLIIDDVFLQSIVRETNLYAEEVFLSENTKEKSRICHWKELTLPEFKIFLGLLFHTGIVRMPQLQHYWRTDKLMKTCFGEYMSRDRFLLILRCMHISNNTENVENPDRLHKIKPAIDYLNNKMLNIYSPSKELSLDESMVLYRGRLAFKQYIKNKRHKYGIKLYMLTEPNGLVIKFAVYAGAMDLLSGVGHAEKVVLYLMNDWLGKGHSIFADNFYNSVSLTQALIEKKNIHNRYATARQS